MTFSAIISGLFAIAKAIPKVMEGIEKLSDMLIDYRVSKIKETYNIKHRKIAVLNGLLKKATTDEEITALSIILFDINKL